MHAGIFIHFLVFAATNYLKPSGLEQHTLIISGSRRLNVTRSDGSARGHGAGSPHRLEQGNHLLPGLFWLWGRHRLAALPQGHCREGTLIAGTLSLSGLSPTVTAPSDHSWGGFFAFKDSGVYSGLPRESREITPSQGA